VLEARFSAEARAARGCCPTPRQARRRSRFFDLKLPGMSGPCKRSKRLRAGRGHQAYSGGGREAGHATGARRRSWAIKASGARRLLSRKPLSTRNAVARQRAERDPHPPAYRATVRGACAAELEGALTEMIGTRHADSKKLFADNRQGFRGRPKANVLINRRIRHR